jgi:hypothetical protein
MSDKFSTAKEAKDFLVGKAVSQAAIENIPLSDPERKLMYYSVDQPSDESLPNSDEDSAFEEKVSGLIRRAWKNDPEKPRYKAAFKKLTEGDHYLSVMNPFSHAKSHQENTEYTGAVYPGGIYLPGISQLNRGWGRSTPLRESGKLFLTALAIVAGMFLFMVYWEPAKESFWHWLHRTAGK